LTDTLQLVKNILDNLTDNSGFDAAHGLPATQHKVLHVAAELDIGSGRPTGHDVDPRLLRLTGPDRATATPPEDRLPARGSEKASTIAS